MTDVVSHRGPDDSGEAFFTLSSNGGLREVSFHEPAWRLGLGHRRLSILDLSALGRQPMCYRRRYWIVSNGEIYNYRELALELKTLGHEFVSTSDTEVILAAFAEWDTDCFRRLRGMWAIVLLDTTTGRMVISRDRLGIKPLYAWSSGGTMALVSEIKQLTKIPGFIARMDAAQSTEYLGTGYELPGRTFFEGVTPVEPGTFATVNLADGRTSAPVPFWHPEKVAVSVYRAEDAAEAFRWKFAETVRMHLRSDVPVGCALSGGLDSSSIASAVSDEVRPGDAGFHTFSASFPGTTVDESNFARVVAQKTNAISHSVEPMPEKFLGDLKEFTWAHDEPVGSLSIYAGYALARLTRENGIKVTLNGQGGDELFAAYWQQYLYFLWNAIRSGSPDVAVRHLFGCLRRGGNPELLRQVPEMAWRLARKGRSWPRGTSFLSKMISGGRETLRVQQLRWLFLPRLLKWEDRNSMAFGVEGRYPFLDHELIDLCLGFNDALLYEKGWVKWPLRLGLDGRLPPSVVWRRDKKGFEVPSAAWLTGPLRPAFESWVSSDGPVWALVSRTEGQRLLSNISNRARKPEASTEKLFRYFSMDVWLKRFGVATA